MMQITTTAAPTIAELAQRLRVLAAVAEGGGSVSVVLSPEMSRQLAHLIDAGGFAGAVDKLVAGKVDEAVNTARATAEQERAAWVTECQNVLDRAFSVNRRARNYLVLTAALGLVTLLMTVLV